MGLAERLDRIERAIILGTKNVLTTKDLALMLNKSESRIRCLTCEGKIPHYKQGSSVFFKKDEIESWMTEHRVPTNDELASKAALHTMFRKKN